MEMKPASRVAGYFAKASFVILFSCCLNLVVRCPEAHEVSEDGLIGLIEMGKQCTPRLQEKELATLIHLFDWRMMSGPSMCVTLVCIDSQTPLYRHNSRRIWQLFLGYEQESYNPSQ